MRFSRYIILFAVSALLFVGGIGWHTYFNAQFQTTRLTAVISQNVKKAIDKLDQQAESIAKAIENEPKSRALPNYFFLLEDSKITAWGTSKFVPDTALLNESFTIRYTKNHRGDYLIKKWKVDSSKVLVGMIPLVEQYKVVNKYLKPTWNTSIFPISGLVISPMTAEAGVPVCGEENRCYFKVDSGGSDVAYPTDYVAIALVTLSIFCFLGCIILFVIRIYKNGRIDVAFLAGLCVVFGVRILTVRMGFPMQWGNLFLFDPQQFASSSYNVTLADFVINSALVLLACFFLFRTYIKFQLLKRLNRSSRTVKFSISVLLLTMAIFCFLYPYLFFEIIAHNSSIQLDITQQVGFNSYRIWAFVAIIFGVASSFLFCHVLLRLVAELVNGKSVQFFSSLIIALLIFYGYCLLEDHDYLITACVSILYFISLYVFNLYRSFSRVSFLTFLYLLVAITAYSVQGGLCVRKFAVESTVVAHARFGNSSLVGRDILGEYLLNESIRKIEEDPFVASRLASPLLPKGIIRQRVQQVYLSSYFDRYVTTVYLFNKMGEPLGDGNADSPSYSVSEIETNSLKTSYEGVYQMTTGAGSIARRYVGIARITKKNELIGFVAFELSLLNMLPQNVYPELLVDTRFSQFLAARDFSYAYVENGRLVNSFGSFNYRKHMTSDWLSKESIRKDGLVEGGFIHNAIDGDRGEVAIVSSPAYPFLSIVANGAFHFLILLLLILIYLALYAVVSYWRGMQPNYATKIQLYVFVAFILPLLVVSEVTLRLISNSNELKIEKELQDRAQQLSVGIAPLLQRSLDSLDNKRQLDLRLMELSKSFDVDVNVYTSNGHLAASSQPEIFNNQLLSNFIDPNVFNRLAFQNENYVINKEEIGLLQFSNSYLAMREPDTGELRAILNLPFFNSLDQNDKNEASVLSNILIVFVAVFIVFALLSYYAVRWLTFPLAFITKTLRATTLGANHQLEWKANDEIGLMVREYNQMVRNLESSRIELARTQKESAWREMAQQVAHEIKNPLTPMKLALQQMQINKQLESDQKKMVTMLLEQVDILNQIASSFSTFAKMPTPLLERKDLATIVEAVVGLYSNYATGNVQLEIESRPIFVLMDVPLMNRILSNLILNSLQSGKESQFVQVRIKVLRENQNCIISIKDDGIGMDSATKEKIFVPYFSTKKAGSGLGLAIAKQGIEQFGGTISFTSQSGAGTTFTIVLPVN